MKLKNLPNQGFVQVKARRLPHYDYSNDGAYALCICAQDRRREHFLDLPELKEILIQEWEKLPRRYSNAFIDIIVIMPDHLHSILLLDSAHSEKRTSVSNIVCGYKSNVTRRWRNLLTANKNEDETLKEVWQMSFYEHIIRQENDLEAQRNYMRNNPIKAQLEPIQNYVYNDHQCPYDSCEHIPFPE
ncbi:REP-associated tyrosine transposase [Dictyobacter arantiisoli]|uniref:Transposase IS200-like domain-containing protein n=1 Tax=Dictyobacter arantiisoli TaxID=2014874 RepID=A0A5A5TB56_9CHLR|nr:transposase [Dictyobacter arantiisoli]GCF08386.1 hypothetical protein KDI_19500 [Dictyobacter arantiisoli]